MPETTTTLRLRRVLADHFGPVAAADMPLDRDPWDDRADLKPIDRVEFMLRLEEEFAIEIPDAVAQQPMTLAEVLSYIDAMTPRAFPH